ncbi:MAG: 16S rRNA (adenine(1518)-N(6)/adenine(1519)-N(6))-dimethyltransferase RsmA [Mycoplasma sp.]
MKFINPSKFIKQEKFFPSRKLGQNFLVNEDILDLIIESLDLNEIDAIVEIGPGLGALTQRLLKLNKKLYLIELDKRLFDYLNERLIETKNIEIFNANVLDFDFNQITKKHKKVIIVANLPYSISSLIIIKFLADKNINTMYCMLQKEVVQRLVAKPKHKTYNSFSVTFQNQAECTELLNVPSKCFEPAPEVDSEFVKLEKQNNNFDENFSRFLKLIFLAKRKTLKNNLKSTQYKDKVEELFKKFKLTETVRSEELDHKTIKKIYQWITK